MKKRITLILTLLTAAGLLIGVSAATSAEAATPSRARGTVNPSTIVTHSLSESPAQVNAFWTPQRLAAAKDMDLLPATRPVPPGPPIPWGPVQSMPPSQPAASASVPIPYSLPGKHSRVWSNHVVRSMPASTVGKLFFDIGAGHIARCTATVITAPNKDTIWTAAHCVSDGHGHWFKNFVFQPARHGNTAPWGGFIAKEVAAPVGFVGQDLPSYDYAGIALYPSPRGKVADLTGSQGWIMGGNRYNWPGLYIFGYPGILYPGNIPVNENLLRYCTGPTAQDGLMMFFHCDMGKGSSGGPLLYHLNLRTGGGWLVGNVSLADTRNYTRWSPQLDAVALTVYRDVYRK